MITSGDNRKSEDASAAGDWVVWRIDDNGNTFIVREHLSLEEANRVVAEFTARGHKQMYWAEEEAKKSLP